MNMLNSVILEGVVSKDMSDTGVFVISSERHTKVGEERITTSVSVMCLAQGNILESARKWLKEGSGLRIVGHLQYIEDKVGIVAEHIEFKAGKPKTNGVEGKYNFVQD